MGNQNKPISETNKSSDKSFNKHQMFADSKVTQDKDQNCFYQVSHSVVTKNIYKNWMNAVEKFQKQVNNNQRYLLLPIQSTYTQEGMCGSAGILKIKFDYYPFTLGEEISNRNKMDQPFDQKQLWYLLFVLTQTAYQFHQRNQIVGDIQPENVFVNQNGDVALYSLLALPDLQSNYFRTFIHKQITYIPPQGIIDTQNGKQSPTYNQQSGESFSIGLTLLDAALLYNSRQLYNKALIFNENKLKQLIKQFHNLGLSQPLCTIIDGLLRVNVEERLTTRDVLEYLRQYEQAICNLEQFQANPLPISIIDKLKMKNNKKPTSRVIHLSNSPHQNSHKNTGEDKFLKTTQFPVYIQNSNNREIPGNFQKPEKIYSFMDPSQQGYSVGVQRSPTNFQNTGPIQKPDISNSRRNSNQNNGMRESNVNRVIGSSQLYFSTEAYKNQGVPPNQNPSTSNSLESMKLKHTQSKDQRQVYSYNNRNNGDIEYQRQNQEKLKSKFLNNYAKESQELLKQYQKISYEEAKKPASYSQNQQKNQYTPSNMGYQSNKNYGQDPPSTFQQYSFGTGHLSNNLTNMGRITTSISPLNYQIPQHFSYGKRQAQTQRQVERAGYNFNKYQRDQGEQILNLDQNFGSSSEQYYQQGPSFSTGHPQYLYANNVYKNGQYNKTKDNFNVASNSQSESYATGKHYVPTMPTTHVYTNNYNYSNGSTNAYQYPHDQAHKLNSKNQSGYSSNYSNQYSDIFSAIDKQLEQSRKMYPGS